MSREIPDILREHSIRCVTDNVPEGHHVRVDTAYFVSLFREEMTEAFTRKPTPPTADSPNEPVHMTEWSIDYGDIPSA